MQISLVVALLCFTSCATVFTGTKSTIQINSVPSGAKIQVNGIDKGTTPAAVKFKKGSEAPVVTLKLENYETRTFQPETSFNGLSILNLSNIVGWGIDALSGAMWKYDPKFYEIQLEKKKQD